MAWIVLCLFLKETTILWLNEKAHNVHKIWLHVAVCYEVYSGVSAVLVTSLEKKIQAAILSVIRYNLYDCIGRAVSGLKFEVMKTDLGNWIVVRLRWHTVMINVEHDVGMLLEIFIKAQSSRKVDCAGEIDYFTTKLLICDLATGLCTSIIGISRF